MGIHVLAIIGVIFFPVPGWKIAAGTFALAWLGHLVEGNKPAFLSNPAHVFVAPVWVARKILGAGEKKSA